MLKAIGSPVERGPVTQRGTHARLGKGVPVYQWQIHHRARTLVVSQKFSSTSSPANVRPNPLHARYIDPINALSLRVSARGRVCAIIICMRAPRVFISTIRRVIMLLSEGG